MSDSRKLFVTWKPTKNLEEKVLYQTDNGTTFEIKEARVFVSEEDCALNGWRLCPIGYEKEIVEMIGDKLEKVK